MPSNLEEKANQFLVAANLTMPQLAAKTGLLELELYALCRHDDPYLSEARQLVPALQIQPASPTASSVRLAAATSRKLRLVKAAAHELATLLGVCSQALNTSNEFVAAKEEIIDLLCGGYNQPN